MKIKMLVIAAMATTALAVCAGTSWAQDVAAGQSTFKAKCAVCHDIGENAKNKVGPFLNGLDGRKTGTVAGYAYSPANKGSGITWDQAQFLDYIKDPKAKIPNTKMIIVGIKNETEAKNLWAFLKQFGADGKINK